MKKIVEGKFGIGIGLISLVFFVIGGFGPVAWAEDNVVDEQEEQNVAHQAELAILHLSANNEWFKKHLKEAKGVFVAPQLYRGRVLTGGSGVLLVRHDDGWSKKAFYRVEVPDLGLQLGSDRVEIILLVNSHLGLTSFYTGGFTLGSDLRIGRGPMVGDMPMSSIEGDLVAFTKLRSENAYSDLPIQGVRITVSDDFNHSYYGKKIQAKEILETTGVAELGISGIVAALQHQPSKGK